LPDVLRGVFMTERLAHRCAIANERRGKKFTVWPGRPKFMIVAGTNCT